MLVLCQHNTLAYYAFYYAGIFDAGLLVTWALARTRNIKFTLRGLSDNFRIVGKLYRIVGEL